MRTFIAFDFSVATKNTIQKIQDNYREIASGKITYTNSGSVYDKLFEIKVS